MSLKKWLGILLLPAVCVMFTGAKAESPSLSLSAKAAVVLCADTGQVLYAQNETEPLAMASTTKIMTALLTLEEAARDDRPVTVTKEMTAVEGSSMGLRRELAEGMLLVSGNDAANTAAIAVGGSEAAFAEKMNRRAKEIGMEHTHFVTPSGLDDEQHYSTALDMAKLTAAALENRDFRELCGRINGEAVFLSPKKTVPLKNHNRLLRQYDGCIGVKTGFTKKAGRCLVSAAERDGVLLIAVTLNAPDDWNDHRKLLDFGFSQMTAERPAPVRESVPVTGGKGSSVTVSGAAEKLLPHQKKEVLTEEIELPRFLYAPVSAGETVGAVRYRVGSRTVLTVPLQAEQSVEAAEEQPPRERIGQWLSRLLFGKKTRKG